MRREMEEERKRNLRDIIAHSRWEARMARKLGERWLDTVAMWSLEGWEADISLLKKNPQLLKTLLETIRKRDERNRRYVEYLHPPGD